MSMSMRDVFNLLERIQTKKVTFKVNKKVEIDDNALKITNTCKK